jgi:hypothetical protein
MSITGHLNRSLQQALDDAERDQFISGVEQFKNALASLKVRNGELEKYRTDAKVMKALGEFRETLLAIAAALEMK